MKKAIKAIILIALTALLCLILVLAVSYFTGYKIYRDVSYGSDETNTMDIYIPNKAYRRESNGVVIFIHGGSWTGGDKADEEARCRILASQGYLAASVNYTLWSDENSSEYTVFSVLDEIDAALAKVCEFASNLGINVDRAAITGYSAGAHLAMLYSYSRGDSAPVDIVFTASMAGPSDIKAEVWGSETAIIIANRLTGEEITEQMIASGEADELLSSISPISYIDENAPPTLIIHGGKDNVVPLRNAESLMDNLEANGVKYDYIHLENSDHSLLQNPIGHLSYYLTLLDYCEEYFGK